VQRRSGSRRCFNSGNENDAAQSVLPPPHHAMPRHSKSATPRRVRHDTVSRLVDFNYRTVEARRLNFVGRGGGGIEMEERKPLVTTPPG